MMRDSDPNDTIKTESVLKNVEEMVDFHYLVLKEARDSNGKLIFTETSKRNKLDRNMIYHYLKNFKEHLCSSKKYIVK